MNNVYQQLHKSVNDLPFLKIINDIRQSNDNTKTSKKTTCHYLADSKYIDDTDDNATTDDIESIDNLPPTLNKTSHTHEYSYEESA